VCVWVGVCVFVCVCVCVCVCECVCVFTQSLIQPGLLCGRHLQNE